MKRLNHITNQLYEVELVKPDIEKGEPTSVGFCDLYYATLRMLKFYYNFFKRFCAANLFDKLELDTNSLCLTLSGEKLESSSFQKKEMRGIDYVLSFQRKNSQRTH